MKKKIFVAISLVCISAIGLLFIACSSESNTFNPNEIDGKMESMLQTETSSEEWKAFNVAVEKLNAKYLSKNCHVHYTIADNDSANTNDTKELKKKIVYADADGAIDGAKIGATIGGARGIIIGAVLIGAYKSYKEYDLSKDVAVVQTMQLNGINKISKNCDAVTIANDHNLLVDDLKKNNISLDGMTRQETMTELINRYEDVCGPVSSSFKSQLLRGNYGRVPKTNTNVVQSNENFQLNTYQLSISELHDYTEDYLDIIDSSISNTTDKLQLSTYATVAYYSTALWIVQ